MFSSLSSCIPSAVVTTSFTSEESQTLVINQPVKVVSANVFYVNHTASVYNFYTDAALLVPYVNPEFYFLIGRTYQFVINTLIDEAFVITNTSGVEYTNGVRYYGYPLEKQVVIWQGGVPINTQTIITPTSLINLPFAVSRSIWRQPFGSSVKSLLYLGPDYSVTLNGIFNYATVNFTVPVNNCTLYFIPYVGAYAARDGLHHNNVRYSIGGVKLTPGTEFVNNGFVTYYYGSWPAGHLAEMENYGGMRGFVTFKPSATTPSTLQIRNRKTNQVQATIYVTPNGTQFPVNAQVKLKEKDHVTCSVVAPATFLSYNYYEYSLKNQKNYFAVVTKNNYSPVVKGPDRLKRFFNYVNYYSSVSLLDAHSNTVLYVSPSGLGHGSIAVENATVKFNDYHIILDVQNYKVNLYTGQGGLNFTKKLSDFPISYFKFNYINNGQTFVDLGVLCADGKIYRIKPDLSVIVSNAFTPATLSLAFINANLPINEDIPFLGSFSDAARAKLVTSLFPVVNSCSLKIGTSEAYLAGSTSLARVNLDTGLVFSTITLGGLRVASVTYHDTSGVIITTTNHRIYYVQNNGAITDLTPPGGPFVLGQPDNMEYSQAGRTAIPDCHNKRLIIINGILSSDITYIYLGDFVPAYVKRFGKSILITGHDTNCVIEIDVLDSYQLGITETSAAIKIKNYYFTKKVTLASKIGMSILAHHFLDNRTTLDLLGSGIKKVIPYSLDYREGPVNAIGTTPKIFRLIGEPSLTPIAGPYIKWWVNGELMANLVDDSYLGVVYRAPSAGLHRSFIILGEHALDYDTKSITDSSYLDHFTAGAYNTLVATFTPGTVYVPPVFAAGTYTLPFDINYFGNSFTEFLFSGNHGVLGFDTTFPLGITLPNFAAMTTNALLIEPRQMYIDYHIDNRIVAAVTWAPTFLGIIPGVFYKQGIIGEFNYYHWKAVGTIPTPNPNGLVRSTESIAQTGVYINMQDFSGVLVRDYASNPIAGTPPYAVIVSTGPVVGSPSNEVLSIIPYLVTKNAYYSSGNRVYVTTPAASFYKYAQVVPSGLTSVYGWTAAVNYDNYYLGNVVLEISGNKVTEEGLVDLAIINKNEFIFEYTTSTVSTTYERGLLNDFLTVVGTTTSTVVNDIVTAVNIQHSSVTFNPTSARSDQFIEIDSTVYNKLVIGQTLKSALFGGTDVIISKTTQPITFRLTVTPQMAWEGVPSVFPPTTIVIDFITTNIPDGNAYKFDITSGPYFPAVSIAADFGPFWTVEWPTTVIAPITIANGPTVNLTIYGNHIRIKIPVVADTIPFATEKLESWNVKVTNLTGIGVNLRLGHTTATKLLIGNTLSNTGVSSDLATTILYLIGFSSNYNSSVTDIIIGDTSVFTFLALPPSVQKQTVYNPIVYALPQPPPPAPPITDPFDTITVDVYSITLVRYKNYVFELLSPITTPITVPTIIDIKGNFLEFSTSQVLPASTPILFKTYFVPSMIEFDVGFWRGRGYQYIEFNYPTSTFHDSSLTIGLRNASNTYNYQIAGTPPLPQVSYLFGGNYSDGILYNLGLGKFNYLPSGGFVARRPRIFKERSVDETTVKYDIYIDQKISTLIDVRASVDYGILRLNDGFYDGSKKINEGDVLTLIVPFKTNLIRSAVILGLGKNQFAIPITPESQINSITDTIVPLGIQPTITNQNISYIILVTGNYFVPDYFSDSTGGGSEIQFSLWDNTGLIKYYDIPRGSYFTPAAGDMLKVNNIFTGYRQYNIIETLIVGSNEFIKLQIQTVGAPAIINYLNYGLLQSPFTQLNRSANIVLNPGLGPPLTKVQFLPSGSGPNIPQLLLGIGLPFNETFDGNSFMSIPYYETNSYLNVTSPTLPSGTPITLFSDQINVTFITHSLGKTTRLGTFYDTIPTNTLLGLEWDLWSYNANNSKIYQITLDPLDNSEVYTEVGSWSIQNKTIVGPILVNGIANTGRSVANINIIFAGLGYDRNNMLLVIDPPPPPGLPAEGIIVLDLIGTGTVVSINLTSGGSGYINPPTVTIVGPFTLPAVLEAVLATDIFPHETEIKIPFGPQMDKSTELVEALPTFDLPPAKQDNAITLLQTLLPKETNIVINTVAYKPNIEFNYITTPQPIFGVFSSPNLYGNPLGYKHGIGPSFFTKDTDTEVLKFGSFTKMLTYGPRITVNPIMVNIENDDKVLPQVTTLKQKMGNYAKNFPVNFFTSKNYFNFMTFIPTKVKPPDPFIDFPFTIFGKKSGFEFDKQVTSFKSDPSPIELEGPQSNLTKELIPQERPGGQIYLFSEKAIYELGYINYLFGDPLEQDLNYFVPIISDPLLGEYQTTLDYYKQVGNEYDTITVMTPPTAEEEKVSFTVLTPESASADKDIFTLLTPESASANRYIFNILRFLTEQEFDKFTVIEAESAMPDQGFFPTMLFKKLDFLFDPLDLYEFDIDGEYEKHDIFLPPIAGEYEQHDIFLPPIDAELIYQDKIFTDISPEWIYQDKLFPLLPPELLYQDKLFLNLTPDIPDPGNRYIDFFPFLEPPANKYIDFFPFLEPPANRYIDFFPFLEPPANRYIEFFPLLEPPANRYIDFIPQLINDLSPLVELPAELYIPENLYLPLTSYRLTEEKFFLNFPPKLDQLNVQYQDGYNLYGAFKTEFLIFADHGRAGDLGQYQGTPPGTPGRTNIPILPYREFMGSALLKYSPTYGFGGFGTQTDAQTMANKYVNATAIKVNIAGFWNYRIHFDKKVFRPRKSKIFPVLWYVRGS